MSCKGLVDELQSQWLFCDPIIKKFLQGGDRRFALTYKYKWNSDNCSFIFLLVYLSLLNYSYFLVLCFIDQLINVCTYSIYKNCAPTSKFFFFLCFPFEKCHSIPPQSFGEKLKTVLPLFYYKVRSSWVLTGMNCVWLTVLWAMTHGCHQQSTLGMWRKQTMFDFQAWKKCIF